ncbi:unnamed protein product [Bursaphelenchus okinawaensis]|uniref:Uncharacterized protein n=1 Tax=Bursaphelenchus okinawaensis TaxID=465554 RepID=A0A811L852_9BILA|nr:unnamed protein product [Bursaphelenchus okinawaensis]CAG9117983.1 unnamed protein product [Bursaphelenchus okinawaensis]
MCFGIGNDMHEPYNGVIGRDYNGVIGRDMKPVMMVPEGVLREPQLSGRPLILRMLAEAASAPSAPVHNRPGRGPHHGNMQWERLGWGW